MKDKNLFYIFHNHNGYTLTLYKNLYNQIKSMIKKEELLKYLKNKVLVKPRAEAWSTAGLMVRIRGTKEVEVEEMRRLVQNLQLVSHVHKKPERKVQGMTSTLLEG